MSFLINREDLLKWSDSTSAGFGFPRLLRVLLRRENDSITQLDMRSEEGARLSGYDGKVQADRATPLVPEGASAWELGTEAKPQGKATRDYNKRTKSPGDADPASTTYVAVTSRSWPRKKEWAKERRESGPWADVRAYDVDDICTALDLDPAAAVVFLELAGLRNYNVQSLEQWWGDYVGQFRASLTSDFVLTDRRDCAVKVSEWLQSGNGQLTLCAPSDEDGRAFVAAVTDAMPNGAKENHFSNLVLCNDLDTLQNLVARTAAPLTIVTTIATDHLPPLGSHRVILIVRSGHAGVVLKKQNSRDLAELLRDSGLEHGEADEYAAAARRSLYRYRIMSTDGVHSSWPGRFQNRDFRYLWLIGGWDDGNDAHEELIQTIFGLSLDDADYVARDDVTSPDPIFSHVGKSWRMTAPRESAPYFVDPPDTVAADLAKFRPAALAVLSELDPALELPGDQRWLANVYGKRLKYGSLLREAVATTLAVLASECGDVPLSGGQTIQHWVDRFVHDLLQAQAALDLWKSLGNVLLLLAEASPSAVLDHIEQDLLDSDTPLTELRSDSWGDPLTGRRDYISPIVHSLRLMLWSSEYCYRAIRLLGALAAPMIDEHGKTDGPLDALMSAFRPALPQCALGLQDRLRVLSDLANDHPEVAATLCKKLLNESHGFAILSETRFRPWKSDGRSTTWAEAFSVYSAVIAITIRLAGNRPVLWGDLVDCVDKVGLQGFDKVVETLNQLPSDHTVATDVWRRACDKVRHHRRFLTSKWALPEELLAKLEQSVAHLEPGSAHQRLEWLFRDPYNIDLGVDGWHEREEELLRRQTSAVDDILIQEGFDGILALATMHPTSIWPAGVVIARGDYDIDPDTIANLLTSDNTGYKQLATAYFVNSSMLGKIDLPDFAKTRHYDPLVQARLLLANNDVSAAWKTAEILGPPVEQAFWSEFNIFGRGENFPHVDLVARRLLDHGRANVALDMIAAYRLSADVRVDTTLIIEGLQMILQQNSSGSTAGLSNYDFEALFDLLRSDPSTDRITLCQLEWMFLPVLEHDDTGSLAIEKLLAESPEDFVAVVMHHFGRGPGGERNEGAFSRAFTLLNNMRYIPGTQEDGSISQDALLSWISEVRHLVTDADDRKYAMSMVGQVLAHAKPVEGAPYPDLAIQVALESSTGDDMLNGFQTSLFNQGGAMFRGRGGEQEREFAKRYDKMAAAVQSTAPRTSAMLRNLADQYRGQGRYWDERQDRVQDGIDPW